MKRDISILLVVLGMIGLWVTAAAADELPQYTCYRTTDPIHIDGILNEPVWSAVEKMVLSGVQDGARPVWRTDAMIVWNATYLYAAFAARDPDV